MTARSVEREQGEPVQNAAPVTSVHEMNVIKTSDTPRGNQGNISEESKDGGGPNAAKEKEDDSAQGKNDPGPESPGGNDNGKGNDNGAPTREHEDNGHGNDADGVDESNPGQGNGHGPHDIPPMMDSGNGWHDVVEGKNDAGRTSENGQIGAETGGNGWTNIADDHEAKDNGKDSKDKDREDKNPDSPLSDMGHAIPHETVPDTHHDDHGGSGGGNGKGH